MKDKLLVALMLLFFCSITLGKQVSDYASYGEPKIDYIISGTVQTSTGLRKSGLAVYFDSANNSDTSNIERGFYYYNSTATDDSGHFNIDLSINTNFRYQNTMRVVVIDGADTAYSPWASIYSATRKETMGTFTSHDCNSRQYEAPVSEVYTFQPQTITLR